MSLTAPAAFRVDLAIHHAILDGWSVARAITDLLRLYDAEISGRLDLAPDPPPPISFRSFVEAEASTASSAEARAYWRRVLDSPLRRLPRRRGGRDDGGDALNLPLDRRTARRLVELASSHSLPLKSLVLAACGCALASVTATPEVVVGVVVHGRPAVVGSDRLLGLFVNSVPIRIDTRLGDAVGVAREVQRREIDSFEHRLFPLAELPRLEGQLPFDVLFNYADFHVYEELEGLAVLNVQSWWHYDRTGFPLTVEFVRDRRTGTIELDITRNPGEIAAATASEFASAFADTLERFGASARGAVPR